MDNNYAIPMSSSMGLSSKSASKPPGVSALRAAASSLSVISSPFREQPRAFQTSTKKPNVQDDQITVSERVISQRDDEQTGKKSIRLFKGS